MRTTWIGMILLVSVFGYSGAYADGGTLTLKTLPPGDDSAAWAMGFDTTSISEMAAWAIRFGYNPSGDTLEEITVEDGRTLTGYSVEMNHFITDSDPPWFFCDMNGDSQFRRYQTEEGYEGQPFPSSDSSRKNMHIFRNVIYPVPFASVPSPFMVDVLSWQMDNTRGSWRNVQIAQCKSVYEGSIRIDEQDYAARLIFRSLNPSRIKPDTCIILDTNRDGVFHPVDDTWFSDNWLCYLNGQCHTVKTTFDRHSVHIEIAPYTGKTGTLCLQGEGIAQVVVGKTRPVTPAIQRNNFSVPNIEFSLPFREDRLYELPVGDYWIDKIHLQPKEQKEVIFQWPVRNTSKTETVDFRIENNQESSLHVGGPLHDSIKVLPLNILGDVTIKYHGSINQNRRPFVEIEHEEYLHIPQPPMPLWTMKDGSGTIVRAGHFEYSENNQYETTIRMPFFGYGNFQVQCLGAGNEWVIRTPVEFTYNSKQPIVWGSLLLILIASLAYLLWFDREFSLLTKGWILLPGIAGILWIMNKPAFKDWGLDQIWEMFSLGPAALSFILLACRILSPKRISHIFFTSLLSSIFILSFFSVFFTEQVLVLFFIVSFIYAVIVSGFYQVIHKKVTQSRLLISFFAGTAIPPLLYVVPFMIQEFRAVPIIIFIGMLFISTFTFPLYLLTWLNPWVRDLFTQRMIDPYERARYEEDDER